MRINRVSRNKIEVADGDKKVAIEVSRVGKLYIITVSDGAKSVDVTAKAVVSHKVISTLKKFGVPDIHRVLSYMSAMTEVKRIEAPRAVFMKVEDVVMQPDGAREEQKVGEIIQTYFHTADGEWRVFGNDWDVLQGQLPFTLKEAYNVYAPLKNIWKLFLHYNTADVDVSVANDLCRVAAEVKEVLKQYVVLDEKYYDLVATWAVATYLRWASPYSELLIIRKTGFGAGGTTLLKTVRLLSARPLKLVVNTTPAAFYRVVDFAAPTIAIDEFREDEQDKQRLAEMKLMAESAFDTENVVLRVDEGEVEAYIPYANVAVVDTTDKFVTYSAERRAWTAVIRESHPPRYYSATEILKATEELREKLYALGIALPTMYLRQWRALTAEQGLGVLRFLERASKHLCGGSEIFASALDTVAQQLTYAKQTSLLSDPKRMVLDALQRIIEEARRELEVAAASPSNAAEMVSLVTPEDPEYKCGVVYFEKLMRRLRQKFMEVWQVDTKKVDSVYYSTSELRYWYRVSQETEMYLKPAKVKALLMELGVALELDSSRHYYVRVCR